MVELYFTVHCNVYFLDENHLEDYFVPFFLGDGPRVLAFNIWPVLHLI